jgi:hypothetical protein
MLVEGKRRPMTIARDDMSSSLEVLVVNFDFIGENLGTLADGATRGSARLDTDKVLAVFLDGGLLVLIAVVGLANEGTIAVESSGDPMRVRTFATILADAILLAMNNGVVDELSAVRHVELVDREIGRSPQFLVALERKLDSVRVLLRSGNDRIVIVNLLEVPLLLLVLCNQLCNRLRSGLSLLDDSMSLRGSENGARVVDNEGLAGLAMNEGLERGGFIDLGKGVQRLAIIPGDMALDSLARIESATGLERLVGGIRGTEPTGPVESVVGNLGEGHCERMCKKRMWRTGCSVKNVFRLVVGPVDCWLSGWLLLTVVKGRRKASLGDTSGLYRRFGAGKLGFVPWQLFLGDSLVVRARLVRRVVRFVAYRA